MKIDEIHISPKALREPLEKFWSDNLEIESRNGELIASLPLLYPNGIQVVVSLKQVSQSDVIVSDCGKTIAALEGEGIDLSLQRNCELLTGRIKAFELAKQGMELHKLIRFPIDGIDIQLFAEALVSISHLIYRLEITAPKSVHVYSTIRNLLASNHFLFKEKENAFIEGKVEGRIGVDFLTSGGKHQIACKTIERRGRMRDYIEQWGFRWRDAKDRNPKLINSMFYDPSNQNWDSDALNIGRSVCHIFEPYFETDKINAALAQFKR